MSTTVTIQDGNRKIHVNVEIVKSFIKEIESIKSIEDLKEELSEVKNTFIENYPDSHQAAELKKHMQLLQALECFLPMLYKIQQ